MERKLNIYCQGIDCNGRLPLPHKDIRVKIEIPVTKGLPKMQCFFLEEGICKAPANQELETECKWIDKNNPSGFRISERLEKLEINILQLIASGMTQQQIAVILNTANPELNLSLSNVKKISAGINKKIGVGNSTQAVLVAAQSPILDEVKQNINYQKLLEAYNNLSDQNIRLLKQMVINGITDDTGLKEALHYNSPVTVRTEILRIAHDLGAPNRINLILRAFMVLSENT